MPDQHEYFAAISGDANHQGGGVKTGLEVISKPGLKQPDAH